MNYYDEIKNELINNEVYKKVKDYSKNKSITISQSNINSFNGKNGEKYSILNTIMLQNQWNKHMLIYDKDKKLLNIKDGQLGMQQGEMDRNNLKAGDKITLKFGELSKEFTITDAIIDKELVIVPKGAFSVERDLVLLLGSTYTKSPGCK